MQLAKMLFDKIKLALDLHGIGASFVYTPIPCEPMMSALAAAQEKGKEFHPFLELAVKELVTESGEDIFMTKANEEASSKNIHPPTFTQAATAVATIAAVVCHQAKHEKYKYRQQHLDFHNQYSHEPDYPKYVDPVGKLMSYLSLHSDYIDNIMSDRCNSVNLSPLYMEPNWDDLTITYHFGSGDKLVFYFLPDPSKPVLELVKASQRTVTNINPDDSYIVQMIKDFEFGEGFSVVNPPVGTYTELKVDPAGRISDKVMG